ncbi:MAG: NAD(P) transhydrogenase subunit alpha [Leptospirales bacterium]|nr:NAD(P) transhydrogenase subunit alpha [Leptospirales bacterium]
MEMTVIMAIAIFVISIFLGVELISKVPPTLHTPLMSGSNAISGITVVGAILSAGSRSGGAEVLLGYDWNTILGFLAMVFATINVIGGYWVTERMLRMFKRK